MSQSLDHASAPDTPHHILGNGNVLMLKYLSAFVVLLAVFACGGDVVGPSRQIDTIFWKLRLNHNAITMANGQTLQLSVTPLTTNGQPISDLSGAKYTSSDTSKVVVDATGKVTAKAVGTGILVIASLYSLRDNVTNADTAWIDVTPTPRTIQTFSIQPPDSTILAVGEPLTLQPIIRDAGGTIIPPEELSIQFGSSNEGKLAVDRFSGALTASGVGTVKVWATTTSYGVTKTDTVEFTVTYPINASVYASTFNINDYQTPLPPYFEVRDFKVRVGATIRWVNTTETPLDIVFDKPGDIEGGNIPVITEDDDPVITRRFLKVGTYTYRSTKINDGGTIVVVP